MAKFHKGSFLIRIVPKNEKNFVTVTGWISDDGRYGYYKGVVGKDKIYSEKSNATWTATDIATGYKLCSFKTRKECAEWVEISEAKIEKKRNEKGYNELVKDLNDFKFNQMKKIAEQERVIKMTIDKDEIFSILSDILGENADGIYVNERTIEDDNDELPIFSTKDFSSIVTNTNTHNDYFTIYNGVSRVCFVPSKRDYVIKIAISGTYDYTANLEDRDWEEFNKDFYNKYGYEIDYDVDFPSESLSHERFLNDNVDLMEEENKMRLNSDTITREILVPNIFIGMWHGMKIYIQDKVEYVGQLPDDYLIPSYDEIEETLNGVCKYTMPADLAYALYKDYGEDLFVKIAKDFRKNFITDLHEGNFGIDCCNNIRVFDYAGYDEQVVYSY